MASCKVRGDFMSQLYANCSRVSSIYLPLRGFSLQVFDSKWFNLQSLDNKGVMGGWDFGFPLESMSWID
jgi:hypothetical protein